MSNPSTVTLVLGNLGGQIGTVDGARNWVEKPVN